jgi:hypothetical protein
MPDHFMAKLKDYPTKNGSIKYDAIEPNLVGNESAWVQYSH